MKKLSILCGLLLSVNSVVAGQLLIADCESKDDEGVKFCLYTHQAQGIDRYEVVWGEFQSCDKLGPKAIASTMVGEDVKKNNVKQMLMKTGSTFLGFGTRVSADINKLKKKVVVKGYAGVSLFPSSSGSSVDVSGRFKLKFESCDFTKREVPWFWQM